MERFHIIDDAAVILRSKGLFRQAKVYRRGTEIFAGWGSGYIRLQRGSGTTLPNVSWDGIEGDGIEASNLREPPRYTG